MAIVKMNKFSLLVFKSVKDELLQKFQGFSKVQFIDLGEDIDTKKEVDYVKAYADTTSIIELESSQSKVKFSIDTISKYWSPKSSIKDKLKEKPNFSYSELKVFERSSDWENVYDILRSKEDRLNSINNEISKLMADIDILNPWKSLDAPLRELDSVKTAASFLGTIPRNLKDSFREEIESSIKECYLENISEVGEELNILLLVYKDKIEKVEGILRKFGFARANLAYKDSPKEIISEYEGKIVSLKEEKSRIVEEIKSFGDKLENLKIVYEYLGNEIEKAKVSENFLNTDKVFIINGWIPEEEKMELEKVIKDVTEDYHISFTEPSEEDDVPIMLKNNSAVQPFESITSMYSLPKYNEIDPTPLLMPFYLLFFGMMLSDAGYGLLMLIATALALKFVPLEEETRNFVKLFFYLSLPTIFWGIMYGSYFTGAINIPAVWMKPEDNANFILLVSMGFGLIHVFIGLGIKAYLLIKNKLYLDAFYDVGLWYITLVSVILYLAGSLVNIEALKGSMNIIKYIMFAGMIGLVLTQGRENKGIGAKLGAGLYGLYGITGYIGDLVSYSRLMALGLATGFIGGALNLIISFLGNGVKAWIFGPLIFVIGHTFNLLINTLGAYVHTSRLQYVEYFGKFYEGGGKPFAPFRHINKTIKIKAE
ncbi:V-type ATP synthase subunit I [Clostridium sp. MSJ-11]|uniref:V-type ATP synthase subunit I n=1 Tax=Clostridium mobile TaxID=2841512 RepID=A0ABS6EIB7_9CLOT|nr:V-type ATP synthase subunit I [Clostridium mobile]MBU5484887.1 V-type ATP synthase subunit I [Clostridium mobile]